ncbi:MAG: DUF4232 domain-containing protein [Gaiellales bacterium]
MRSRIAAAVALLASLWPAVACGGAVPAAPAAGAAVVPWVDRPAPAYTPPPLRLPPPYPDSAPPCRASQLRVTGLRGGAAAGNVVARFAITNTSRSACRLGGYPALTGIAADGVRRTISVRRPREGTMFGQMVAADIAPGRRGYLDLATTDICPEYPLILARRISIRLPTGGRLPTAYRLQRGCHGWSMSRLGLFQPQPEPPPRRPGSADTLRVTGWGHQPVRATAGRVLHFQVILSNPTSAAVRLRPCPSYTEGLYAVGLVVTRAYRLNCSTVRVIRPHGRVRYAMQVAVPAGLSGGATIKLGWHLNTPREPAWGWALIISR